MCCMSHILALLTRPLREGDGARICSASQDLLDALEPTYAVQPRAQENISV